MSDGPSGMPTGSGPGPASTRFWEVRHFAEVDSTNRYLLDEARAGAAEGLVAVAEHQTAGRGRLGRRWEAPPGANLLASVLLVPALPVAELHLCSVAVALAASEACRVGAALEPDLKWPNDLLVDGRKLAGVLAETLPLGPPAGATGAAGAAGGAGAAGAAGAPGRAGPGRPGGAAPGDERRAVVVGIGLNVGWPPPEEEAGESQPVPEELRSLATSIRRETGVDVAPRRLLELMLVDLERRLVELENATGRLRLAHEYRTRCATVGRQVVVVQPDGETRGTAIDITPEGHLVIDVGACFTTVTAGDVVHVRNIG